MPIIILASKDGTKLLHLSPRCHDVRELANGGVDVGLALVVVRILQKRREGHRKPGIARFVLLLRLPLAKFWAILAVSMIFFHHLQKTRQHVVCVNVRSCSLGEK